ncbi:hypothetical protein CERSUDRAFT_159918 [Gelatoporia subvermispora B]|uniref:Protein kinase domain-containing protein n=1 Tax=Ceriporiopsis subvermispora (strain B) TaxID=914234 RepID=M2PD39_CERS8|nr:hypothetical protein CERSUDRAFT_159918 [Gelatoporia subvermispora B]
MAETSIVVASGAELNEDNATHSENVQSDQLRQLVSLPPEKLRPYELYWSKKEAWLRTKGYELRPRYRAGWKPSWEGTKKRGYDCEDGQTPIAGSLLDATRVSDGKIVMLKSVSKRWHPYEVMISEFFASEPLASNPRNHCVPIIEVFQDPDAEQYEILVMPFLRLWRDPFFNTIGEFVDFFGQICEGLLFIHEQHVAHRDIGVLNIMMDPEPMFPNFFHPTKQDRNRNFRGKAKYLSRTRRPPKYYIIDFGLSRKYPADDPAPRELPIIGGDKSVPEHQDDKYSDACDPFATDVYCLGNLIQKRLLQVGNYLGLDFIAPLIADMRDEDPQKRPLMSEVVQRFSDISSSLSIKTLRHRLIHAEEDAVSRFIWNCQQSLFSLAYIALRLPPVPRARHLG